MNGGEIILLAVILLFCGGLSGAFTFVSLKLIWQRLEAGHFFISVRRPYAGTKDSTSQINTDNRPVI